MFSAQQINQLKTYLHELKPTLGGKFLYYLLPYRKKVVLANMRQVFGDVLSTTEIIKLAQCFYSHISLSFIENFKLRFMSTEQIRNSAMVIGAEHMWNLENHPIKGAILITGHFGNWEFAPIAGILNFKEFQGRFYFVRKLIGTKTIEKILFKRYYEAGLQVIPKRNSLDKVCHALETNNCVVFVMDQHASIKAKDGIMVDFFGKKAGTFKSPAMIAKYTQVPVLPARNYRRKDGKHVLEFFAPLNWIEHEDPKIELALNTRKYNEVLEHFILEHPEQWLWMHKRWKSS